MTVQNRQIEPKEMAPTILKCGFRVLLCLDANSKGAQIFHKITVPLYSVLTDIF